jgi:hypothetical protein
LKNKVATSNAGIKNSNTSKITRGFGELCEPKHRDS